MSKLIDLTRQRFGRLTVVGRAPNKKRQPTWKCQCECGNLTIVQGGHLRAGISRSCGCLSRELLRERNKDNTNHLRHGQSGYEARACTGAYSSWRAMKTRAINSNATGHENYYDRGITICDRWLMFENFYEDMGDRPKGMSIDRIGNDGNYEPGNCRWATREQQYENKRRP